MLYCLKTVCENVLCYYYNISFDTTDYNDKYLELSNQIILPKTTTATINLIIFTSIVYNSVPQLNANKLTIVLFLSPIICCYCYCFMFEQKQRSSM